MLALKNVLLFTILVFTSLVIQSQNIIVDPYLQDGSPTSMLIMWETDATNDCFVDWGTDAFSLNNTVTSTSMSSDGSNRIHTASITGLNENTKYYYKVRTTTGEITPLYTFNTHPTKSSEANINLVAMSDMQRDGSNPNVFQTIVDSGVIPISIANFTNGVDDLEAILIPGDLVVTGSYNSWRNDFFTPADDISPFVPIYPVPGNHEYFGSGVGSYFNYMNLPLNGSASNPEEWWYKDISNIRIIGLNSNNTSSAEQLPWLETVLNTAGTDSTIDFVFVQLHHPYKSELWTPGESDFTGDVITRIESFSTTYGKPSIHFFGHTHGYSRGQSRDHNHLWVNVATAGGAIDNWGEFPNADYEEFTLSEDEYGFVMLEIEAGADPKFVLKRYSQGDQDTFENNTLSDEITIKRFDITPDTPIGISPSGSTSISCVNLKASDFANGSNSHQATHWQIVEGCDFGDASVMDIWKQSENWYNEVNTQLNDDLTDEEVFSLSANTNYCWRVRYRNENLTWSAWSTPLSFTTTDTNYITANLLLNNDAESGITNWTGDIESLTSNECNSVPTYEGSNFFAVGGVCANEQDTGLAFQNIDVSSYASQIDAQTYLVEYSGYLRSFANNNDLPELYVEFLDENNVSISTTVAVSNTTPIWTLKSSNAIIPVGTRTLKVTLRGNRLAGSDNDSYYDALSIRLLEPNCPTLGISQNVKAQNPIKIYPNPVDNKLFYVANTDFETIYILDMQGKIILTTKFTESRNYIDTSSLSKGTYVISFSRTNGTKKSYKFLKN